MRAIFLTFFLSIVFVLGQGAKPTGHFSIDFAGSDLNLPEIYIKFKALVYDIDGHPSELLVLKGRELVGISLIKAGENEAVFLYTENLPKGQHTFRAFLKDNDGNQAFLNNVTVFVTEEDENIAPAGYFALNGQKSILTEENSRAIFDFFFRDFDGEIKKVGLRKNSETIHEKVFTNSTNEYSVTINDIFAENNAPSFDAYIEDEKEKRTYLTAFTIRPQEKLPNVAPVGSLTLNEALSDVYTPDAKIIIDLNMQDVDGFVEQVTWKVEGTVVAVNNFAAETEKTTLQYTINNIASPRGFLFGATITDNEGASYEVPYINVNTLVLVGTDPDPVDPDPVDPDPVDPIDPDPIDPSNRVVLPVVMIDGKNSDVIDGLYSESRYFNINIDTALSGVFRIDLLVSNLEIGNVASISLNDGQKFYLHPEESYISINENRMNHDHDDFLGVFGNKGISVSIPASQFKRGSNKLTFHYADYHSVPFKKDNVQTDYSHYIGSGYRVVDFNIFDSMGKPFLRGGNYELTDYNNHKPFPNRSVENGKKAWFAPNTLIDSPHNKKLMAASCFDCHEDGTNLKVLNFEPNVVAARAKFHGLPQKTAEEIANYILSLERTESQNARPWSNLYQPGPQLKDLSISEWIAGATIENDSESKIKVPYVLENNKEMMAHYFGETIDDADLSYKNGKDTYSVPVFFPFFTYHKWLPTDAPQDSLSESIWNSSAAKSKRDALINYLDRGGNYKNSKFYWQEYELYSARLIDGPLREKFNTIYFYGRESAYAYSIKKATAATSLSLVLRHDLASVNIYGNYSWAMGRTWPWPPIPFNTSPLQAKVARDPNETFYFGDTTLYSEMWDNHIWYYLQLVLNPQFEGDNRNLDTGNGYIKGVLKDIERLMINPTENESVVLLLAVFENAYVRMAQKNEDPSNAFGGPYLPHIHPSYFITHNTRNWDKMKFEDQKKIVLALFDNFMDRLDTIPFQTLKASKTISAQTNNPNPANALTSQQINIWAKVSRDMVRYWEMGPDDPVYQRYISYRNRLWPNVTNWP